MGKSEILEALSREEHAGRFRWWFERQLLSRKWLAERLDEVIEQVGPRYNRDLTVGVPAGRKIANFARLPHLLVDLEQHAASAIGHIERLDPAIDLTSSAQLYQLAAALPTLLTSDKATTPDTQLPVGQWRRAWQALQATVRTLTPPKGAEPASEADRVHRELTSSPTCAPRSSRRSTRTGRPTRRGPCCCGATLVAARPTCCATRHGSPSNAASRRCWCSASNSASAIRGTRS
ncbi:hypothetical protein ABZS66_20990 [Dactylosporangium sp. NPDC005572]|uniref:hypothetical protein n=1 Tax=Dactylosporangium sp. NPDC005572 TaxID=3156889 RepID=UPI0033A3EF23